ncbi:MAG TPA: response regulator [Candidatus Binatia bacterium]|nr:response regulator [Candidatus Binatia bacterium]
MVNVQRRRRLVLIVDDDAASIDLARLLLEREGYRVLSAQDGDGAVAIIDAEGPDAILINAQMRHGTGLPLIGTLLLAQEPIPIIAAAGGSLRTQREVLGVARTLGAAAIVAMPFDGKALIAAMRQVLPEGRQLRVPSYLGAA